MLYVTPTRSALRLADVVAVCGQFKDGILVCAEYQVVSDAVQNLGVRYSSCGEVLCPHSICLLVQGTKKTELLHVATNANARVLVSDSVKCICPLTTSDALHAQRLFRLRSFCSENDLLDFKLDATSAFVWISAVISSDNPDEPVTYVVDQMERVDASDIPKACEYMMGMYELSSRHRGPRDLSQAEALTSPQMSKRAKTLHNYPSDTGDVNPSTQGHIDIRAQFNVRVRSLELQRHRSSHSQ